MVPVGNSSASSSTPAQPAATQDSSSAEEKKEEAEDVKGDPEMAPVYLKNLLPLFAKNYKETMMPSIRKATLALMRKMIHYASQAQLEELSQNSTFASVIVEVLSVVLDHEVRVQITKKKKKCFTVFSQPCRAWAGFSLSAGCRRKKRLLQFRSRLLSVHEIIRV